MNNANPNYRPRLMFGALLVGIGIVFLLRNMGVISHRNMGWCLVGGWVSLMGLSLFLLAKRNDSTQVHIRPMERPGKIRNYHRTPLCQCQRCQACRFMDVGLLVTVICFSFLGSFFLVDPDQFSVAISIAFIATGLLRFAIRRDLAASYGESLGSVNLTAPNSGQQNNSQVTS